MSDTKEEVRETEEWQQGDAAVEPTSQTATEDDLQPEKAPQIETTSRAAAEKTEVENEDSGANLAQQAETAVSMGNQPNEPDDQGPKEVRAVETTTGAPPETVKVEKNQENEESGEKPAAQVESALPTEDQTNDLDDQAPKEERGETQSISDQPQQEIDATTVSQRNEESDEKPAAQAESALPTEDQTNDLNDQAPKEERDETQSIPDQPQQEVDATTVDAAPEVDYPKEVREETIETAKEVVEADIKSPSPKLEDTAVDGDGDREVDLSKDQIVQDVDMEESSIPHPSAAPQVKEDMKKQMENSLEPEVPPPPPAVTVDEKSAVETATARDILVSFREEEQTQPLSLNWTFGFNRHIGCLNLSNTMRNLVMYAASHVAVLLDFQNNVQKLLLGHANAITCIDCSSDKRWIVTADKGENSSVIIWDSYTGIPVQSIFDIPGNQGVVAVAMSPGAKYVITISAAKIQTVNIWDWTTSSDEPICSVELPSTFGVQTRVSFCPGDNEQFSTNSDSQVVFYSWATGKLEFHAPFLSDDVFNRVVGLYSQTIYQENSKQALTGTSLGNIVVWDPERSNGKSGPDKVANIQKRALKLVRLQDRAITTLTYTNGYIVTGDVTGAVKFYDSALNLINWYNKGVEMGPVTSISFRYDPDFNTEILAESNAFPDDATIPANPFIVRDFSVSTKHAEIFNVHADGSAINRILCEHDAAVHAIAASSTKPWICIGSYAGLLKIWNYETKQCTVTRIFEKGNNIQCVTFDSLGLQIAVGMTNGMVYILDSISLSDVTEKPLRYARDAVTHIAFSHDSKYLATADADLATTVFEYDADVGWKYLGRYRAHYKPIKDLSFGIALDSNLPRLLTLGEDRTLVEYDLQHSCKDDLRLLSMDRIEQSAVPSCLAWYPDVTKESFLVTANDQYKFKLYNTTTKMCRKTLLAPTYGSSVRKIIPVPPGKDDGKTRLLAYVTKYKVGLQILPLDGNPHKSVALVGHPSGVSHLACSHDGKHLFTAGGKDSCVHMWSVSAKALEAAAALGGDGLLPFYGLLEGGADGELFAELENYFYFAQLRSQGLNTTEAREVSTVIPLDQIPFVMRALGFYPSEQEIEDMTNEVKFSEYVETGQYVSEINLGDFIKLYVNHRPAFGLSPEEIHKAFKVLGNFTSTGESSVTSSDLYNILQRKGEHMTERELSEHLATLLGISAEGGSTDFDKELHSDYSATEFLDSILPSEINASMFSGEILGLPVYDSQE